MAIKLSDVTKIVSKAVNKTGVVPSSGAVQFSGLDDSELSVIVNDIKAKFENKGMDVVLSEIKLKDFNSIGEAAKWCFENQVKE